MYPAKILPNITLIYQYAYARQGSFHLGSMFNIQNLVNVTRFQSSSLFRQDHPWRMNHLNVLGSC